MAAIASISHRQYDVQTIAYSARKFPLLSAEHELEVSRKLKEMEESIEQLQNTARHLSNDDTAISETGMALSIKHAERLSRARQSLRDQLVCPHLRLVVKMAMAYKKLGLPMQDLIQEGSVGLTLAVDKFEPEKGFRFSTYAQWWIRASLQEYIFNNMSSAKIANTNRNKKIIKYLTVARKKALTAGENPYSEELLRNVAKMADASYEDVQAISSLSVPEKSLNATIKAEDNDSKEFGDTIADDCENPEELVAREDQRAKRSSLLETNLAKLDERERAILRARKLKDEPETLEELAVRFDISRERVRQIETKAFEKLQDLIRQGNAADRWASQDKRYNHSQASANRLARPAEPAKLAAPSAWVLGGTAEKPVLVLRKAV
jgi:RNA polymerase sigma-32 factor